MKTIIPSIAFVFLHTILVAQPFGDAAPDYRIVRQNYENSSGEFAHTVFLYNHKGTMYKAFWTLDDSSRYSVNYYEYDNNGNLVSAFRDFSDNLTSFEKFSYDESGNKMFELFTRSDGKTGSAEYTYDDTILQSAGYKNYKGWLKCDVTYIYVNGKRQKANISRSDEEIGTISYSYDKAGNLICEIWDFNGKWSQTFTYSYENKNRPVYYYASPFLSGSPDKIIREDYTYNNETGGPSEYFYSDGLLEEKVFTRSDGLKTITNYTYDADKKLVASTRQYATGKTLRFTYEYDEDNHLIMRNCYDRDSLIAYEAYLYDSDGMLTKAYLRNFDGWLTGNVIFKVDEAGWLKTGIFKSEEGPDAEIMFTPNSNGFPESIRWNFSNGKYQQYKFFYEQKYHTKQE
ncbi:hypothetical protein ACE1ET_19165 [Saccharicrinis sp. FJH62]|uniref:hypothetical protein n=1 Tax=Saccharicrinis sp. FJH62 TaxID=3344657 RepID=UPI0035D40139